MKISDFFFGIKIKEIKGDFFVGGSSQYIQLDLYDLEGSPEIINGNFICMYEHLKSLKGGPRIVNKHYNCRHNDLITLEGSPEFVGGDFDVRWNEIETLKFLPKEVEGDVVISNNWDLLRVYKTKEKIVEKIKQKCKIHGDVIA